MSWSSAESSLLPVLASTDWPERRASTPSNSRKPQVAAGRLSWNGETVDDGMFIVN